MKHLLDSSAVLAFYFGESAAGAYPDARPFLVRLDAAPPSRPLPHGLTWAPAARWLLEEM